MYRGIALIVLTLIILIFVFKPKQEHLNIVAPGVYNRDEAKVTLTKTSGAADEIKRDIRFGAT
jgi:hypothetical protein